MLDSHSKIYAPGPTHIGRLIIPKIAKYGDLGVEGNFRRLVVDVVALFDQKQAYFPCGVSVEEIMENVRQRDFFSIYEYIYKKGMVLQRKQQVFIKENHSHRFVDHWLSYFPRAKFVFQVRDPRDFYLSAKVYRPIVTMYHSPSRTINAWKKDQEQSLRILLALGPERVFFLRYEDLIANPESNLSKLCEFLGLPFERGMLDFHKNESVKNDSRRREKGWKNLSRKVLSDNKEKFAKGLSRFEIIWIERCLGGYLQIFNYKAMYDKVSVSSFVLSTMGAVVREVFANIYCLWRDTYRRWRDIVKRLLSLIKGVMIDLKRPVA